MSAFSGETVKPEENNGLLLSKLKAVGLDTKDKVIHGLNVDMIATSGKYTEGRRQTSDHVVVTFLQVWICW